MTSGKPEDVLIYKSNQKEVYLSSVAGNGIINTDGKIVIIDAGTF